MEVSCLWLKSSSSLAKKLDIAIWVGFTDKRCSVVKQQIACPSILHAILSFYREGYLQSDITIPLSTCFSYLSPCCVDNVNSLFCVLRLGIDNV